MAKPTFSNSYSTHSWEDRGVHTFPKGVCLKVNIIARLEFKLTYYDSTVPRFNHYTMRTPPILIKCSMFVDLCKTKLSLVNDYSEIYIHVHSSH